MPRLTTQHTAMTTGGRKQPPLGNQNTAVKRLERRGAALFQSLSRVVIVQERDT